MDRDLSGKIALVTGASRGIGKAIAKALYYLGAEVLITGRHEETLKKTAQEIGDRCHFFVCDHSNPTSITKMTSAVLREYSALDILVNNAGSMKHGPVMEMPLELWNKVIGTNLTGVFLTTQSFLPGMIEKNRGDIIMISSMSGKKGDPGAAAYAASKFGLQGFSQALMYEVRRNNIRVMVLNPSLVDKSEDAGRNYGPGLALHADDIADTVAHLVCLPGRTMIRDMDIYGTNPF